MTVQAAPAAAGQRPVDTDAIASRIADLVADCGGTEANTRYVTDLVTTSLKLLTDGRDTGELKLLTASFKEMRHAMRVFGDYREQRKVSIFGSARTPVGHPDYLTAVHVAALLRELGWLCITGAGDGIMKAGHEGSGRDSAFGLAIRLPFETSANHVIVDDVKLVYFRYFFARKTMFLSQSDAIVSLPGGFGTLDEVMESLTLVQTGKSRLVPVVLLAGGGSTYWDHWEDYVRRELLAGGFISEPDLSLFYRAANAVDAVEHIRRFYFAYHSSRYVGDDLVLRLTRLLNDERVEQLNDEFARLVVAGRIDQRNMLPVEREHPELPRLVFTHTRRDYGLVRQLIDRINDYAISDAGI